MNDIEFKQINTKDNIQEIIKDIFDMNLNISGGWGYDNKSAVIVNKLDIPKEQFIYMFATIRANIEMNITLDEYNRYSGINVSLNESKKFEIEDKDYEVVNFKITAMKEKTYANFIQEYKDNYGKKGFDLSNHFKEREKNTINKNVDFWFYGLED